MSFSSPPLFDWEFPFFSFCFLFDCKFSFFSFLPIILLIVILFLFYIEMNQVNLMICSIIVCKIVNLLLIKTLESTLISYVSTNTKQLYIQFYAKLSISFQRKFSKGCVKRKFMDNFKQIWWNTFGHVTSMKKMLIKFYFAYLLLCMFSFLIYCYEFFIIFNLL